MFGQWLYDWLIEFNENPINIMMATGAADKFTQTQSWNSKQALMLRHTEYITHSRQFHIVIVIDILIYRKVTDFHFQGVYNLTYYQHN
jgi:hypothetical protein